jgi:two-component system phosphate regulon sensor histidine kinase PhoR
MLETIRDDARGLSGEKLSVHLEADAGLDVAGEYNELYSAFSNLVFNAVQYTPPLKSIFLRWYEDDEGAHLEVEDQGVGIDAEHIPRLTERFYRVDKARSRALGGTGLGLAIVKHVLIRHGAKLRITSSPGEGSTFVCDFPPSRIIRVASPAKVARG